MFRIYIDLLPRPTTLRLIYRPEPENGQAMGTRWFPQVEGRRIFCATESIRTTPLPFLELFLVLASVIPEDEDQVLGSAIRNGDRSAFRRFFERHHAALLRYLQHRRVDPGTAEDLVQNAFVYVWEHRAEIREDGSIRGLLYRIAYTRALNHFRDTARFVDAASEMPDTAGPTTDPAEASEIRDHLRAAINALPERRRAVFELCFLEELSYREAAEALDISIKTVENQMGHALKAVRERLGPLRKKT